MKPFLLFLIITMTAVGTSVAEEMYSPREKLLLMKERISRDLEYARELRGLAMSQKGHLEEIMRKAKAGTKDPSIDPEAFEEILRLAPLGLRNAEETLAKTEKAIQGLTLRLEQTDNALKNLPGKEATPFFEVLDIGGGYSVSPLNFANVQLLRHGHEETISLGQRRFLPGDTIVTDKWGQTSVKSSHASGTRLTVGPDTRIQLEKDRKEGAEWRLEKGVIHCRVYEEYLNEENPLPSKPAVITTADAVILGNEESEFDVRIDEKGQTFVEVYQGKVEVKEPKKGTSYVVKADPGTARLPRWWEERKVE